MIVSFTCKNHCLPTELYFKTIPALGEYIAHNTLTCQHCSATIRGKQLETFYTRSSAWLESTLKEDNEFARV